jgi:hypothetical protein
VEYFLLLFIVTFHEESFIALSERLQQKSFSIVHLFQADLLLFSIDGERPKLIKIASYGRHFIYLCFINPSSDHIATLNASGYINIWAVSSGNLVCTKLFLFP